MTVKTGTRVLLRPIGPEDVSDEYVSWLNDEEIKKTLESPSAEPYTREMLKTYIEKIISDPNCFMFAIVDKISGKHIGNIKLHNFSWTNGTAEYGLIIGEKSFWGKGYGEEASRLLLDFAFRDLKIRKVWFTIHSNNPRVAGMVKKMGFNKEGQLVKHTLSNGEYVDKIIMGLFSHEFIKE